MFDLDLEFDDDFSTNVFNKCLPTENIKKIESDSGDAKFLGQTKCLYLERTEHHHNKSEESNNIVKFNEHYADVGKRLEMLPSRDLTLSSMKGFNTASSVMPNLKRGSVQKCGHQKKRFSGKGTIQRKFPGPAGLLPDKPLQVEEDFFIVMDKACKRQNNGEGKDDQIIYSQSSAEVFLESTYQRLILDFDLNESDNPLSKYTIEWVKKATVSKTLQNKKIPFLAVVVHYINHSTPDPVLSLRDPTGEIKGTLHREVWNELGGKLRSGITLALRQVGVLITGVIRRQIHLNITINNIIAVYCPPSEKDRPIVILPVNGISKTDLIKNLEEPCRKNYTESQKETSSRSLFTTVGVSQSSSMINFPDGKCSASKGKKEEIGKSKVDSQVENLADLGIFVTENDFIEAMNVPMNVSEKSNDKEKANSTIEKQCKLEKNHFVENEKVGCSDSFWSSQTDSEIFEEVLSGINLDEFK